MSVKPFQLVQALRERADGALEALDFKPGVNVIVGEPNTGKSKWCRTIDYVLGDDKTADKKLGVTLTAKYHRAAVTRAHFIRPEIIH